MASYEEECDRYEELFFSTLDIDGIGFKVIPNSPDNYEIPPEQPQPYPTDEELIERLCLDCLNLIMLDRTED